MKDHVNKIKKTVIIIDYRCNNRCRFCIDEDKRHLPARTTQQIFSEMADARARGRTYLELIGGELTIRPDIFYLIKSAKDLGFRTVAMATNGRMFSYEDFAEKIIRSGLDHVIFSIHGHNGRLHDSLTQSENSFRELMKGLKNLRKIGFDNIGSNTTIVKQNYKSLFSIGKFIYGLGIRNAEFIFVDPTYGGAHKHFKEMVPRISEASPYIRKCLKIGKDKAAKHWVARYVPLCYFTDYLNQISELSEVRNFESEHLAPDFKNYNVEVSRIQIGRQKTARCSGCRYYAKCEGIWREYIRQYGDKELNPVLRG